MDSRASPEQGYAEAIAVALKGGLGQSRRAIKTVMRWTGANERTVKNWLAGAHGPRGEHLIAMVPHSDAAFEAVMLLAGRNEVGAAKRLVRARNTLVAMLESLVDMTSRTGWGHSQRVKRNEHLLARASDARPTMNSHGSSDPVRTAVKSITRRYFDLVVDRAYA